MHLDHGTLKRQQSDDLCEQLEAVGRRRVKLVRRTSPVMLFPSSPTAPPALVPASKPVLPPAMPAFLAALARPQASAPRQDSADDVCARPPQFASIAAFARSASVDESLCSMSSCDASPSSSRCGDDASSSRGSVCAMSEPSVSPPYRPQTVQDAAGPAALSPTALAENHVRDLFRYYPSSAVVRAIKKHVKAGSMVVPAGVYKAKRPSLAPGPLGVWAGPALPACVSALARGAGAVETPLGAAAEACPMCSAHAIRARSMGMSSPGLLSAEGF